VNKGRGFASFKGGQPSGHLGVDVNGFGTLFAFAEKDAVPREVEVSPL
jgi:hypothetical protein